MNILINQTLHGYQSGHQLLASSVKLDSELSKILLFQSDLTGSLNNTNFETYLTGYPISKANVYIISRTWYAREMKRPGCVWTHSLLIKYPDLGKIPELSSIVELFKRPSQDMYSDYQLPLNVELNELLGSPNDKSKINFNDALYTNTYENKNKTIIIPAVSPQSIEMDIIDLWSNQWPRLRRNFYFCTGALSIKNLGERLFDLQVVPPETIKSVMRTRSDIQQYSSDRTPGVWLDIFKSIPKNTIRRFLWKYGSDINGVRSNFIPLITLYYLIYNIKDIVAIDNLLRLISPNPKEGKNLKTKIFGEDSILRYPNSEKEIVIFLLNLSDIEYLESIELNIEPRLIKLVSDKAISIPELFEILSINSKQQLSETFWSELKVDDLQVLELLETNYELAMPLLLKNSELMYNALTWQLSFDLQQKIFKEFTKNESNKDWKELTKAALCAQSDIIFEILRLKGDIGVNYVLDLFNNGTIGNQLNIQLSNFITKEKNYIFIIWLQKNESNLHSRIFALIFNNLSSKQIINLPFSHTTWIKAYSKLKLTEYDSNIPYVASILLTIGFNNYISGAEWVVSVSFQDVYDFAGSRQISDDIWRIIPKEYENEPNFDDMGFIESILLALRAKPKKNSQVEFWDYQENLVRTLCNKTINNNWNPGAFLSSLQDPNTFYRTVNYCVSIKKGHDFILKTLNHIEKKKIKFHPFQYQYLRKIKK